VRAVPRADRGFSATEWQVFLKLATRANAANNLSMMRRDSGAGREVCPTPVEKDFATRLLKTSSPWRPPAPSSLALQTTLTPGTISTAATLARRDADAEPELNPRGLSDSEVRNSRRQHSEHSEVVVDAKFQALDCEGEQPVMQFTTAEGPLRLLMDSPGAFCCAGRGGNDEPELRQSRQQGCASRLQPRG